MSDDRLLHLVAYLADSGLISVGVRASDLAWIVPYLQTERRAERIVVDGEVLGAKTS